MIVTLDGKTYRITPGGRVWAGYTRPSQPELGVLWRPLTSNSARYLRVLQAAGLAAPEPTPAPRRRFHLYAEVTSRRRYA